MQNTRAVIVRMTRSATHFFPVPTPTPPKCGRTRLPTVVCRLRMGRRRYLSRTRDGGCVIRRDSVPSAVPSLVDPGGSSHISGGETYDLHSGDGPATMGAYIASI
jgi:hypothetical protein